MQVFLIYSESVIYKSRIDYIERLAAFSAKYKERKLIIEKRNADIEKIIIPWAFSVKTLLLSSLESPHNPRTFFITDEPDKFNYNNRPDLFLCTDFWPDRNISELNNRYFILPFENYRLLEESL